MQTIYLIGGAFGETKRRLFDYVKSASYRHLATGCLSKVSYAQHPHPMSPNLSPDLNPISQQDFDNIKKQHGPDFFFYEFGGQQYGFLKSSLTAELQRHNNVLVVCRVPGLFTHIREAFPMTRVVRVWIYLRKQDLHQQMKDAFPTNPSEVTWRMNRYLEAWPEFLEDPSGYHILWFDGNGRHFEQQVDDMIRICERSRCDEIRMPTGNIYHLVPQAVPYKDAIMEKLRNCDFSKTVFVMIRFCAENQHIRDHIRSVITSVGLIPIFADDPKQQLDRTNSNPIAVSYLCKYGVAIFDESHIALKAPLFSPSVVYEFAVMKCIGKPCVMLRHDSISMAAVPFDLCAEFMQQYSSSAELEAKLRKSLLAWQ